jgi:hypothetical protein
MKKNLPFLLIITAIVILGTSCRKLFFNPENRIEGQWKLKFIERRHILRWTDVTNRYETGVFVFDSDGAAFYEDPTGIMSGTWVLRETRDGYYDADGNYQNNSRMALTLDLYNFQDNRVLNLDFDNVRFKGKNQFLAEYSTPTYLYRYDFRRN